jgi:hypothetical protein
LPLCKSDFGLFFFRNKLWFGKFIFFGFFSFDDFF